MIVALDPRGAALPLITCGLTLLTSNESFRYLGVPVGQQNAVVDNWDKRIRSLNSGLALSREKTHTVEQWARLASAIAVPKIASLARHCWPPPSVVTRLKSMIQDFFWVVRDGKRSRTWVPSEVASLPIHQGSRAVSCIQTELMRMAATAVGQWAATASSRYLSIGDCLWGSIGSSPSYITPCWNDDKNLRYHSNL